MKMEHLEAMTWSLPYNGVLGPLYIKKVPGRRLIALTM